MDGFCITDLVVVGVLAYLNEKMFLCLIGLVIGLCFRDKYPKLSTVEQPL
jgi:hypothetical protein